MEKRVNKKVITMFEKAEDEYNDLMSKKRIIEVSCDRVLFRNSFVSLLGSHIFVCTAGFLE